MNYRLSKEGETDIRGIFRYTRDHFGGAQASAYHRGLEDSFDMIANNPRIGRARPDIDETTRSITHRSHTIYYDIQDTAVLILRVLHGQQDPFRHLKK